MGQPTARLSAPSVTPAPAPEAPVQRDPIPFPAPALAQAEPSPEPLTTLGPEHVEPIEAPHAAPDAAAPATIGTMAETSTMSEPAVQAPSPRRALVAEDSIAARIYLVRLLEQHGFDVHAAATATEMRAKLARGPWALVCADCALPDVAGVAHLPELVRAAGGAGAMAVALVRDAEDDAAARAAGVYATLRKPIDRAALERLLDRMAHDAPTASGRGADPDPREWGAR
jgi:CheY-like chemotaxis protein